MQTQAEQSDEGLFEDMTPEQQQHIMQEQFNISDEDLEEQANTESADPLRAENTLTVMGADRPSNPNIAREGSFAFNTSTSGGTVPLPSPETQARNTQADSGMQNTTPPPQDGHTDAAAHNSRHTASHAHGTQAGRPGRPAQGALYLQMPNIPPLGSTEREGRLVRTPIIVMPEITRYNQLDRTSFRKAAQFRARGLTPLPLQQAQIQDAESLRNKMLEFADLSNNHYIPRGLHIDDILRLYVARTPQELLTRNMHHMIYRLVAAEVLEMKQTQMQRTERLREMSTDINTLKQQVHDMQERMDAYDAEYEAEGMEVDDEHPQPQQADHAAEASVRPVVEVHKLIYMSKMGMFKGHLAEPFRSWQEWSEEFLQRAVLVSLNPDQYYAAASVQLAQDVRDAWIAHTKANPGKDNWASLQEHMQVHYAPLDKSEEAEKRFMEQRMSQETEQALQTFSNIQIRNITEMGADSRLSSKGLWNHYMSGLYGPLVRSATTIYSSEKAAYDALTPIARITKMQERLMPEVRTSRSTNLTAEASGTHVTERSKRVRDTDTGERQAQQTYKMPRYETSSTGMQPNSDTYYEYVPSDMTPETCPDVGYQSNTQSKPFNSNLKQALIQERKCLACWQTGHQITACPSITPDIARGMAAPRGWSGGRRSYPAEGRGYRGRGPSRGDRFGSGRGRGPPRAYSGPRGRFS